MKFGEEIKGLKKTDLENKEFSNCYFIDCDFTGSNFRKSTFKNCKFEKCNLTLIKNDSTSFDKIEFIDSKIIGVRFDRFRKENLSFNFKNCFLKQCSFNDLQIPETKFIKCSLEGVDFEETNLEGANFRESLFQDCSFENCILKESVFLKAKGFIINPTINNLQKARFSKDSLYGLVKEFGIRVGGK